MSRRTRQGIGHPLARWWADRAWPVLAGATAAVGTLAAATVFGVGAVLSSWLGLAVLVLGTLLGLTADGRFTLRRVIVSVETAAALVTLAGLATLFDGWALVLAALVALTSPALGRLAADRVGKGPRPTSPPVHDMLADPHAVDAAFEDIVTRLEEPGRRADE